jgi:hypothetical protein
MDSRDRLLASIGPEGREAGAVDFGDLVRKLLVCDQVVLESGSLAEFPLLAQKFGYDGVRKLLESRRVRIHCELITFGETGRTTELESREKKGALPMGSYSFSTLALHGRRDYIHKCLQPINETPGLNGKQTQHLRKLVGEAIYSPPSDSGVKAGKWLGADLDDRADVCKTAIAVAAVQTLDRSIDPDQIELRIERIDAEDYRTETNLDRLLGLGAEEIHELVGRGLLGVGGLNMRLELMDRYDAVTGFRSEEIPLFDVKLKDAARRLSADHDLAQVTRVLDLTGLPDVDPDPATADVDLPRFLEILESDEAREFRAWVRDADSLDDKEIKHQLSKMRELIRHAVHSDLSKAIRWAAITGAGIKLQAPEAIAVPVSGVDSLVLDKLVSKPGRLAFVSKLFPTIYKR